MLTKTKINYSQSMKKNLIKSMLLILITTCLHNCKKENTNQTETSKENIIVEPQKVISNDIKFEVTIIQQKVIDSIDYYPKSKIDIMVNGKRYEIAKVPGEASIIDKSEYQNQNIPKTAISSCYSWFAGSGDFFYVIQSGNKAIVYKGWDGEGNEDNKGKNWEIAKQIDLK